MLFRNELHEDFGSWPLAYIPYGGADFGEVRAVAPEPDATGARIELLLPGFEPSVAAQPAQPTPVP